MSYSINLHGANNLLEVKLTGKLTKELYEELEPVVAKQVEEFGKLKLLVIMQDFEGWTCGALWEDTKFDLKHWRDFEKLALVGDKKWEQGMAAFCKPFTSAKIQYFDLSKLSDAESWVRE